MSILATTLDTLSVLGDENRLRLCLLLSERELNVSDLVRVTGMSQSGVSTHLGRLRDAGLVRDRREGAQCFYTLAHDALPATARQVLSEVGAADDPTVLGDRERLSELEVERRARPDTYSPGRTWQSLATGIAALLDLGDVLDVGSGDGSAASVVAPYCRSLTCLDASARAIESARVRFEGERQVRTLVGDAEAMPFEDESFDAVLVFHTLTYTEHPDRALRECARVMRSGARLVALCLDAHRHQSLTSRYGERHAGFSPRRLRALLVAAGLVVRVSEVASREAKKPHLQVVRAIATKEKARARKARA